MPVQLNHTIVAARDAEDAARWFADLFGVAAPRLFGHFWQVDTANGVALDFASVGEDHDIAVQHYAFLVSEDDFDAIFGRVLTEGLEHWADPMAAPPRRDQPQRRRPGRLLPQPRRPLPRDHHPPLRQRRLIAGRTFGLGPIAGDGEGQGVTDGSKPVGTQRRDARGEARLADDTHVVDGQHALDGHPVGWIEEDLGRDAADRAGDRHGDELGQYRDAFIAGQYEDRPARFVRDLVPPDLAASYHDKPASSSSAASRLASSWPSRSA